MLFKSGKKTLEDQFVNIFICYLNIKVHLLHTSTFKYQPWSCGLISNYMLTYLYVQIIYWVTAIICTYTLFAKKSCVWCKGELLLWKKLTWSTNMKCTFENCLHLVCYIKMFLLIHMWYSFSLRQQLYHSSQQHWNRDLPSGKSDSGWISSSLPGDSDRWQWIRLLESNCVFWSRYFYKNISLLFYLWLYWEYFFVNVASVHVI